MENRFNLSRAVQVVSADKNPVTVQIAHDRTTKHGNMIVLRGVYISNVVLASYTMLYYSGKPVVSYNFAIRGQKMFQAQVPSQQRSDSCPVPSAP